jgi:hypothetical protein
MTDTDFIISLNVGGSPFATLKSTLIRVIKKSENDYYGPHLLQLMVTGMIRGIFNEKKEMFIDRNPVYFVHILDYLRSVGTNKQFKLPDFNGNQMIRFFDEAEYFNLQGLLDYYKSSIVSPQEFIRLNGLCEFPIEQKWKLVYRGSVDGFEASAFHVKCDGKTSTLTIIKSSMDYVFGGYTNSAWDQSGSSKADTGSFIFTLKNKLNSPLKLICIKNENSIFCNRQYGPTFGMGFDICIHTESNATTNSYSTLGHSFQLPPGHEYNAENTKAFLAGSHQFQVKEIEVYTKA